MSDAVSEASSKDRILDAAEVAFSEGGFDGASLRQIVAAAGVNLATVYYHFVSKEVLLEAVVERRLGPLKRAQLGCLREIREKAGRPLEVEAILHVMLSGTLALALPGSVENQMATRLLGRMIADPNPKIQDWMCTRHAEVREAFFQAFKESLPQLPTHDLLWRLELIWGALAVILCSPGWAQKKTFGTCEPASVNTVLPQMISFFAAGLRAAPVTSSQTPPAFTS